MMPNQQMMMMPNQQMVPMGMMAAPSQGGSNTQGMGMAPGVPTFGGDQQQQHQQQQQQMMFMPVMMNPDQQGGFMPQQGMQQGYPTASPGGNTGNPQGYMMQQPMFNPQQGNAG